MFKKILVAEDFDTYSLALAEALKQAVGVTPDQASFCDDAMLRIKKALQEGNPYDLLITDLSFAPAGREEKIRDGAALAGAVRELDPDMSIIVFSIEDRLQPVQHLVRGLGVEGYILKGRNNIPELRHAIEAAAAGRQYLSPGIRSLLSNRALAEIDSYDIGLLRLLAGGTSQSEISGMLRQRDITPNSVSSVEKRINRLKTILGAGNNVQLIAMAKDYGLI